MCGIVGVIGDISYKEEKAFANMVKLDTIRGPHSTGIIRVARDGEVYYDKWLGTPWQLNLAKANTNVFSSNSGNFIGVSKALIGHNRLATTGVVNVKNAHPFEFKNVIGVHNGTLDLYDSKLENPEKHEVDSAVLLENMNDFGFRDTIAKTCGAYAVAMYDKDTEHFHLIRNSERPMFYAFSKDRKTVFFASEDWMIEAACDRQNIGICKVQKCEPDTEYYWDAGSWTFNEKDDLGFYHNTDKIEGIKRKPNYANWWANRGGAMHPTYNGGSNSKKTGSVPQVGKRLNGKKKKLSKQETERLQSYLSEMMDENGYIYVYPAFQGQPGDSQSVLFQKVEAIVNNDNYIDAIPANPIFDVKVHLFGKHRDEKRWEFMLSDGVFPVKPQIIEKTWNAKTGLYDVVVKGQFNSMGDEISFEDFFSWIASDEDDEDEKENALDSYIHKIANEEVVYDPNTNEPMVLDPASGRYMYLHSENQGVKDKCVEGYNRKLLTQAEYEALVADGCSKCQANHFDLYDANTIHWLNDSDFLCGDCSRMLDAHDDVKTKTLH